MGKRERVILARSAIAVKGRMQGLKKRTEGGYRSITPRPCLGRRAARARTGKTSSAKNFTSRARYSASAGTQRLDFFASLALRAAAVRGTRCSRAPLRDAETTPRASGTCDPETRTVAWPSRPARAVRPTRRMYLHARARQTTAARIRRAARDQKRGR